MGTTVRFHPDDLAELHSNPDHFRFQREVRLVVAASHWKPHVQEGQTVPGGPVQFQGPMMDLLQVLAHSMNFTFVMEKSPDGAWGTLLSNGTVTGMVGMVHRQEADMALGPFALTADRVTVVDFATPLFSDATRLIGTRGRPEVDPWGFLLPFTPSLWAATLGSLGIGVAAALILLTTRQKTQTSRPVHKMVQLWQAMFSLVFVYSGVLFQQGLEARHGNKGRRWAGRLMMAGWACTAMVLAWAYMGALTSLLTVRYVPQPFQTLASLGNHPSVILLVFNNTAEAHLMQTAGPVVLRGLEKVREKDRVKQIDYDDLFKYTASTEPWVLLGETSTKIGMTERLFAETGRCDYYTSREIFISYTYSIILQKNSPLLRAVNARMQAVMQAGLYEHWLESSLPNGTYCSYSPSIIAVQDTLSLTNLWGVFTVLAGGLGFSCLAFICELVTWDAANK